MEPRTYTSEYRDLVALVNAQGDALKKCQQERDDVQASLEIRELTIERLTHEREQALVELKQRRQWAALETGRLGNAARRAMEAKHWEPDDYGHEDKEAD